MKWLCVSILVLNVAYFAWAFDQQVKADVRQAMQSDPIPPDVERLHLLSEFDTLPEVRAVSAIAQADQRHGQTPSVPMPEPLAQAAESASDRTLGDTPETDSLTADNAVALPAAVTESVAPVEVCYSIGPFDDERDAIGVDDWFRERRSFTRRRVADDTGHKLFWIYLEPMKSRAVAEKTIAELQKQNIQDYMLVNKGDLRNAISLGLFSSQASVNRRLGELESKGYKPIVVPYYNATPVYWVDVRFMQNENLPDAMFEEFVSTLSSPPVRCQGIAMAPPNP